MKPYLYLLFYLFAPVILHAQGGNYTFGDVTPRELYMKHYDRDSTADAVVLKEFGETYIDNTQKNILTHLYHVRIKILTDRGTGKANFIIPIHKSSGGGEKEAVFDIKGSTFNAGSEEAKLRLKNVFTENKSRYTDLVKFTLPNVKAGSVIEVQYTLSSPFIYNFRGWDFQSDIPKMYSEYWAKIPANLDYNISLIGYYKLTEDERSRVADCLTTFNGGRADCTLLKLGMKDVPAFKEEKYMTAKSNFLSAVHFELAQINNFNGSVRKVGKTWDDIDRELHINKDFGIQLKKGVSFFGKMPDTLFSHGDDDVTRAKKVYAFIRDRYRWNGYMGIFCESGIKKSFENHQGNIGDINLALAAALRAAGSEAYPVLVSTRDNGIPHDLFQVVSDFNYVLVRLKTKNKTYLLDASRPWLPFGVFPMACINGRGRAIYPGKPSAWIPVTAPVIEQATYMAQLTLDSQGHITGTIMRNYHGYLALDKRREIRRFSSRDAYIEDMNSHWANVKIVSDSIINLDDPEKPLEEKMTITLRGNAAPDGARITIDPFFQTFNRENPFKSAERHFPIDFGAPQKLYTVLVLHYPPGYRVISSPKGTSIALPDQGGKYILSKNDLSNTLILKTVLQQNAPVYSAAAYPALKEFYNRIVQSQRADLILSKTGGK